MLMLAMMSAHITSLAHASGHYGYLRGEEEGVVAHPKSSFSLIVLKRKVNQIRWLFSEG